MSDGYQPNTNPNPTPPPPPGSGKQTPDQMIGDATTVMSSFMKDPVGAIRMAWDQKKIAMAAIVGIVIVGIQLVYSIVSNIGYGVKFGYMLGEWLRSSITMLAVLALLALIGTILVKGHCNSGYIGALSGVGAAAMLPVVGLVVRTVFLLIYRILPFWLFQHLYGIVSAAVGIPLFVAMFVLLALVIRRKTGAEDDFSIARNTVALAAVYYVANYIISNLLR